MRGVRHSHLMKRRGASSPALGACMVVSSAAAHCSPFCPAVSSVFWAVRLNVPRSQVVGQRRALAEGGAYPYRGEGSRDDVLTMDRPSL